jgi:hypothetical protein
VANSSGARPISAGTDARRAPAPRAARVGRWLCLAGAAIGAAGLVDVLTGADSARPRSRPASRR